MHARRPSRKHLSTLARSSAKLMSAMAALAAATSADGQTTFTQSFTGTTAPGWLFFEEGGSTLPVLTANTVDTPGTGWLRLNTNTANQSTAALLDTQIFSVGAQLQVEMDYAFWNGSGADGITFFLIDGSTTAANFSPGAFGGSLGYANRSGIDGITGGYLGFGFDNWGNFAGATEGRNGGVGTVIPGYPNRLVVRGPGSGQTGYDYIASSPDLSTLSGGGQMDFPSATTRPSQTGVDFRQFRLTLDSNNILTVDMKFGAGTSYITAFTTDLSAYERPETLKIGFTASTGGANEIHEVRNLTVTSTAFVAANFEWDNGAGATKSYSTGTNWVGDNAPTAQGDLLFRNASPNVDQTATQNSNFGVRSLNFESTRNYTLNGTGTLTLGDGVAGNNPGINVTQSGTDVVRHKINNNLTLAEAARISNIGNAVLCLNGIYDTNGKETLLAGDGSINFNNTITGSGPFIKNGTGITTLNAANTAWTGALTINQGVVAITNNDALGTTGGTTTVNSGGALYLREGTAAAPRTTAEPLTLAGTGVVTRGGIASGALHADGGVNVVSGPVTLTADTAIGGRIGSTLTLSGTLAQNSAGNRDLDKVGGGLLILSGTNSLYDNQIRASGGALRFATAASFNNATNYAVNGGVFEIGADLNAADPADLQITLGTGNFNLQWTGDGGFAAHGADRSIQLNYNTADVTWGAGSFVPTGNALVLGSTTATHRMEIQNSIVLGAVEREIRAIDGSSNTTGAVDGRLLGVLSGTGGINKTGDGTLEFAANNTYTGATRISDGALRVANTNRIDGSNLQLNGGVLEIDFDFNRNRGTGTGDVRWTGSGGFAAASGDRAVNLNNNTNAVTWGTTANFVATGSELILGSTSAAGTLQFDNGLNLGAATRTIRVVDSVATAARAEARLTQAVSNGSLALVGNGRLDSQVANGSLAGTVDVRGAELRLNVNGTMGAVTGFTVRDGGTFTLDNAGTHSATTGGTNNNDRIAGTVTFQGGTLNYQGTTGNNDSTESIGAVTLSRGANTINSANGSATGSAQLTLASLARTTGATVDFTNVRLAGGAASTLGAAGDNSRILVTGLANTNGIVGGYATVGDNWATEASDTLGIAALGTYETSITHTDWAPAENISVSTAISMGGAASAETVNSLRFTGAGGSIAVNDRAHRIESGGILVANGATATITADNGVGSLNASTSADLIIHTQGTGTLAIQGRITNEGATAKGLTKAGDGTLTLSGAQANSYTGATTVNAGTLVLAKTGGAAAIVGTSVTVGDGRGTDTLRLGGNNQIVDTATVTLRGGELGNTANVARLELNGATNETIGSRTETFATLAIEGNTVLDFGGGTPCSPTFLFLDTLTTAAGSQLSITNWTEFTDYLLVSKVFIDAAVAGNTLPTVVFDGYPGTYSWQNYNAGYYQITPVPEPSTYGLLAVGGLLGLTTLRRRRQARPV